MGWDTGLFLKRGMDWQGGEEVAKVRGIRGAITIEQDSSEEVISATTLLLEKILEKNAVDIRDIGCILFTATPDIKSEFPAKAAREMGLGDVPLMCFQEMDIEGSLKKCIRVMVLINTEKEQNQLKHVYLHGAAKLREDLSQN